MLRIDLGCGDNRIEGFDGLDARPLPGVKYVADVRSLPFGDASVDELAARHVIEHFTRDQAMNILREWRRVLKPGAPITIWCPNLLYIAEQYLHLPDIDKNPERKYHLLGWLYGEQNYPGNYHYFAYDWWLLSEFLLKAGFDRVEPLHDIHAQNLCVRAYNVKISNISSRIGKASGANQERPPKILVESTARVFGDSLLSYPLTAIFKAKYSGAHVAYAAGNVEKPLFEIAETVDEVTEKTVDNPSVPLNDRKYDIILRGAFDVDEKWQPGKFIDGFDGPDGWDRVREQGVNLRFKYTENDIRKAEGILSKAEARKKIMMFIPTRRPNMSIPWEISGWDIDKYQKVVDILNAERDDLHFFTFYGFQEQPEQPVSGKNVTDLGRIAAYDEVLLFSKADLLISTSTAVSAMIAPLVETPQIVIHTCEEDESPVWAGIPDKCVLPQARFTYLCSEKTTGEVISFVKPNAGGRIFEWNFNHYWDRKIIRRRMRVSHDIEPEVVAEEVIRRINDSETPGREWFMPQGRSVCESCRLKQEKGICIYDFKPRLRNGLWMGENTGSVMLQSIDRQNGIADKLSEMRFDMELS
jgi:predicted SAM-dependent methyltransferase